jgi:hypothetical protein
VRKDSKKLGNYEVASVFFLGGCYGAWGETPPEKMVSNMVFDLTSGIFFGILLPRWGACFSCEYPVSIGARCYG